ncbi:hypothetical protein [Aliarcobacter butzleri]|uniref:hypothetical protein n=1 Tax=Aliarcobacter butzleri TaxID=28197 RepID=UPI00125F09CC|nr:hypothetical protein [Aliarcobacter butzleri]MCT7550863.1 hypothetical protein [Aliarcobacter butzleri]MCT7559006.1 hypothetical protein [Aliarcobacter butzleri]MCT7594407.1 hypothetical protein [Aliarcobacter butzleri]MCT7599031.1 hypothetical protein [Aliarcobacter butzleri]MCT7625826.1 hypothetical protein [Aliarcobacter butzleri]
MSNYKVEFTLKQHTPIIHFQSDQMGATLRATELKPKFDRFLIQQFKKDNISYDDFLISGQENALNYKVNIKVLSNSKEILTYKTFISKKDRDNLSLKVGSYFGDLKASKTKDNIQITFISFDTNLLSVIKKYFIDFINITNFGTRQNKGFGSFEVIKIDEKEFNNDILNSLLKYYPKVYKSESNEPLRKIMSDYQLLKSGSSKPQYKKSLLFEYMCNSKVRWEKRMIKEFMAKDYVKVFSTLKFEKEPVKCNNEQNFEYQYIRGLLGISEQIEFLKNNPVDFKDKIQIRIKSSNDSIKRYKSPITFKVINRDIYVLATNDIPIKGKKFQFSIEGESGILNKPIEVPKEFDIFKFLDSSLSQLKYQTFKDCK